MSRAASFWPKEGRSFLDANELAKKLFFYIATVQLEIFPQVYKPESPKFPLCVTKTLSYVGRSSKRISCTLTCPENELVYAKCDIQDVIVNPETRKPSPFPDWWMEKYGRVDGNVESPSPLILAEIERPSSCHEFRMTVHHRDCDDYQHTNWASYGNFCLDTCYVLAKKAHYKSVNCNSLKMGLKSMEYSMKKETKEFEELNICSWEKDCKPNWLYFDIQNGNNESCCQAALSFYDFSCTPGL